MFRYVFIIGLLFTILFNSCQQRHWFRGKVWVNQKPAKLAVNEKKKKVFLNVINRSPGFISPGFEKRIHEKCVQKLYKNGFVISRDSSEFVFTMQLQVDSFQLEGYHRGSKFHYHPHEVKALEFDYRLLHVPSYTISVDDNYELYFFGTEKRDLRRSVGVVNYILEKVK